MSLTTDVKEELAAVVVTRPDVMTAEVAGLLRYTAALHLVRGEVVVEAEVDSRSTARRLVEAVDELFDLHATVQEYGGSPGNPARFTLRWSRGGTELARRTGLIDRAGRPVRGLPPFIIGGTAEQCVAALRGAFLACGSLTDPGRSSALEITTPGNEAALALVGAARRAGVTAKTRDSRGAVKVVVRDGDDVNELLALMGATDSRLVWEEHRRKREVRASTNRLANFDDANLRRSARAAVVAAARAERALALLGDDVPDHLAQAGTLRVQHREASLEELGRLADPPMTKDAVAGRIRRLLTMADRRAAELGVPDTSAAVVEEDVDGGAETPPGQDS